jgi:hypothetical protein
MVSHGLMLLVGPIALCGSGGLVEDPAPTSRAASQPVDVEGATPLPDKPPQVLRLEARVSQLERSIRDMERYLGGPTRNLTLRPDTDLRSLQERLERRIDQLTSRVARMQRDLDSLARRLDRVERRR